jgi:8-oxo-dGTP pyrophosphatase MutT (NUDIX family)
MSGYIMDMRKLVGTRPILQCGASVIVENEKGEILLQLRCDNLSWAYAGGSVELDEKVEDAAKRELYEETGLAAEELELFGVFSGPEMHYVYPNGDEVSNIDMVYICRRYKGTLRCDYDEVKQLKFFPINDLPSKISKPNIIPLQDYLEYRAGRK